MQGEITASLNSFGLSFSARFPHRTIHIHAVELARAHPTSLAAQNTLDLLCMYSLTNTRPLESQSGHGLASCLRSLDVVQSSPPFSRQKFTDSERGDIQGNLGTRQLYSACRKAYRSSVFFLLVVTIPPSSQSYKSLPCQHARQHQIGHTTLI